MPVDNARVDATGVDRIGTLVDSLVVLVQVRVGRVVRRMAGVAGMPMSVPMVRVMAEGVRRVRGV